MLLAKCQKTAGTIPCFMTLTLQCQRRPIPNGVGFVDHIDHFDPALFGISSFEAAEIDPQQRMVMETSWRLIENAGWKKERLKGSDTGVFIGISNNDYLYMRIKLLPGMEGFNAYSGLGNANSIAANRVSYYYDLKGPSMAIDTACSSSLTAFHLGVKAIQNGDCEQAIVGGVNAILSPGPTIALSQTGMMSPEGRCKAFDASADGYVRSEGCGLVMLKKRSAAERDGDIILSKVVVSVTSQDGYSHGITFPNGEAQSHLIKKALRGAGMEGGEVGYVEAHGTGTAAGDPTEMEQIRKLYGLKGTNDCYVGSVKANIGHLEASAGIASVIKTVLMMRKKRIPPRVNLKTLNPKIKIDDTRLKITKNALDWETSEMNRKVAISSFGFGGALAHVILEEPVEVEKQDQKAARTNFYSLPFVLSGYSTENISVQAGQWLEWLEDDRTISFTDLCRTKALCQTDMAQRACFVVNTKKSLQEKLNGFLSLGLHEPTASSPKLCYLFTGQGEHYLYMGKDLYERFPAFRIGFERCLGALEYDDPDFSLKTIAYAEPDSDKWKDQYMQPILFATQYALGTMLQEMGLLPDVLLGHSLGEYAAACIAGCFSPETGMKILRKRGELVESLSEKGFMATVYAPEEEVRKIMDKEKVQIAAANSPKKTVISGEPYAVMKVCHRFKEMGIDHYTLRNNQAYHSYFMDPIMEEYRAFLEQFDFAAAVRPWISSVDGN